MLQRVSANVKEYEAVQANFAKLLGTPHTRLSDDLLDAFNHDPAAVTGNTRRLTGWRAVEDIHRRIHRQRETLQRFVATAGDDVSVRLLQGSLFGEGMVRLMEALAQLDRDRTIITTRSKEVAMDLAFVKALQSDVKAKYNETLTHVSAVYPEVSASHISIVQLTSNTSIAHPDCLFE